MGRKKKSKNVTFSEAPIPLKFISLCMSGQPKKFNFDLNQCDIYTAGMTRDNVQEAKKCPNMEGAEKLGHYYNITVPQSPNEFVFMTMKHQSLYYLTILIVPPSNPKFS